MRSFLFFFSLLLSTLFYSSYATPPCPIFPVSGGGNISAGQTASVTLTGGPDLATLGMTYDLFRDGMLVAGSSKQANNTSLTWTVSQAGTYTVKATEPCMATMSGQAVVTINTTPPPTPPSISRVINGTGCKGGIDIPVELQAIGSNGTYTWYDLAGNFKASTTTTTGIATWTTQINMQTSYRVTVTDANGTSAAQTVTAYLYTLPTPSISGPFNVCSGQAATLVASGAPEGSDYSWYDAAGNLVQAPSSATTFTTPTLTSNTTYSVAYQLRNTPTMNYSNCLSGKAAFNVVVGGPKAPAVQVGNVCEGNTVSLFASGLPAGGTYYWYDASNNLLQNSTSPSFTATISGATTTYRVSIFQGCESTKTAAVITSVAPPSTSNGNSCGPGSITLQATSPLSATTYTHRWYTQPTGGTHIGVTMTNQQANPITSSLTAYFSQTTSYYVSNYNTITGCESARTLVTATVQPSTIFSAPNYTLCNIGKAYLYVSGAPAGSTITWFNAAGTQVGTGSTYTTASLPTSTFYTVAVAVAGVCTTTQRVEVTVNNLSGPPTVASQKVCWGQRVTFKASGAPAGAEYYWYDDTDKLRLISTTGVFQTDVLTATRIYYVAYLRTTTGGSCMSDRVAVTASVHPSLGLPTTSATTYAFADNDDYIVKATPGTNGNACRWYETATGGFPFEGLSYNPSSECLLSKNVYVSTYNSTTGCEGDRKMITLTVGPNFCKNLVRTWQVQKSGVTDETTIETLPVSDALQTSQYFDGLGRLVQEVAKQQSPEPLKRDLITSVDYDGMGRESKKYLPHTSGTDGFYKRNAISEQAAFYAAASDNIIDDDAPYSTVLYEASPLNRVLKQGSPGTIWQPNNSPYTAPTDRSVKINFEAGLDNEVLLWTYTPPTASYPLGLVNASTGATPLYYTATQLAKNKTKDEHQNEVIDYQDKEGRTILRKVQAGASDWVETYYIHDDFGRLVAVIPPEAVRLITKATSDYFNQSDATKEAFLKKWAYRYRYDARNRLIEKQLPGADFIAMVYDNRDRVVLMQDGNQRVKNEWSYTKYDALNRAVITGIYRPGVLSRAALQTQVDDLKDNQGTKVGYQNADVTASSDGAFPSTTTEVLSTTYYDTYAACAFCDPTNTSNPQRFQAETWVTTGAEAFERSTNTRGLVVATSVKVLGEETWLKTVNYYDYQNRVIQSVGSNYRGGYDRSSFLYDFAGKVVEKLSTPSAYTAGYTAIRERLKYDHVGRLMKQYHQIGSNAEVLLVNNAYNELGQLIDKKLHSNEAGTTFAQSIDYQFNIRNWLTNINNSSLSDGEGDRFGMDLLYTKTALINNVSYPGQFNGNISAIQWQSNDGGGLNKKSIYGYSYDALNRLKEGRYATLNGTTWTGDAGMYDEVITGYDKNGNIKGLERYGKVNNARTGIDMLTYIPNGNQIDRIDETGLANKSFKNAVNQAGEYLYDANGNLYKDLNKGISEIKYNYLNLPQQVKATATAHVTYTYSAAGVKLRKTVTDGKVVKTDYMGIAEYQDNVLSQLVTTEGRAVPSLTTPGAFDYEYNLKDHLGNVRLTVSTAVKPALVFEAKMETKATDVAEGYTYPDNVRQLGDGYNGSSYSARLNGAQGTVFGPSIALKVSPGDKVNMEVFAKYIGSATHNTALLSSVKSNAATTAQTLTEGSATAITNAMSLLPLVSFTTGTTVPRAYLNYIFFDEEFNFTVGESGFDILKNSTQNLYEKLAKQVTIKKEGYLYIYVANESNANVNVFFDDFKVSLTEGPVVAKTDYYPFGSMIEGLSHASASTTMNKYLYNGKEFQDDQFGGISLAMYDYGARMYDAQLGRWNVVDPHASNYFNISPYSYCIGNPVNFIDPDGKDVIFSITRDKKGNISGVNVSSTVYISGAGASQERANKLNKNSPNVFKSRTINGVKISININYKYTEKADAKELKAGENVLYFVNKLATRDERSHVAGSTIDRTDNEGIIQRTEYTGR